MSLKNQINISCVKTSALSYSLRPFTRIYIYPQAGSKLEIDTIEQTVVAGALYIIPPLFLFLGANEPCICIEIPHQSSDYFFKRLLYHVLYVQGVKLEPDSSDPYDYTFFYGLLLNKASEGLIARHLIDCISHRIKQEHVLLSPAKLKKLALADQLMEYIHLSWSMPIKPTYTSDFQKHLAIDEKSLQRLCNEVFNCPPKSLADHQRLLQVFYLFSKSSQSIADIAYLLGFSDSSNFGRFVKNMTGVTPTQLREKILARGIDGNLLLSN